MRYGRPPLSRRPSCRCPPRALAQAASGIVASFPLLPSLLAVEMGLKCVLAERRAAEGSEGGGGANAESLRQ
jgi:hypothetical protein